MKINPTSEIFEKHDFYEGRMISPSKSLYRITHPTHDTLFNANIFTEKNGKIWWGDLDLTLDDVKLKQIAQEIGEDLYILREMDGRFENSQIDFKKVEKSTYKKIEIQKSL